jgi:DNA-binding NarL/FixJ family response regulator
MSKLLKNVKVLVVEDEMALNAAYVTILESENIKVETSFNGKEALEKIKEVQPDVILLDLKMPKMSGIEFLEAFSKLKPKLKSKVIVFSNYDKQDDIKDAFSLGASKYMLKAWASPTEIVKLIKETV